MNLGELFCIVEGHAEVRSIPLLVRRIAGAEQAYDVLIHNPFRLPRGKITHEAELGRVIEFGVRRLGGPNNRKGILLIIDADDDCPAELGPGLLRTMRRLSQGVAVGVVVANKEYEAWFLASAESLRGRRGIRIDAENVEEPEGIRDAKGFVARVLMEEGRTYSPTIDQPGLTAVMDIGTARRCRSFDKICREIVTLVC